MIAFHDKGNFGEGLVAALVQEWIRRLQIPDSTMKKLLTAKVAKKGR
jgi:hypothetical protein